MTAPRSVSRGAVAAVAATKGRKLRSFTIRKEAKDHGVTGRIAGPLRPGDKVVVTDTLKAYREFKDMKGVVCRIVKAHTYLLCVRLDTVRLRASVRRLNANQANCNRSSFLQQDEGDLLLLTLGQVRVTHKAIPPRETRGKRKRDAESAKEIAP
jgi:hypothetical protein